MTRDELLPIFEAMENYGGGFVQALANAMRHADSRNLYRLANAFPELIEEYRKFLPPPSEPELNTFECIADLLLGPAK